MAVLEFSIFTRTQTRLIVKVKQAPRGFRMFIEAALFMVRNLGGSGLKEVPMVEKVPMTITGYKALEDELKDRQQNIRGKIIREIEEARAHGDLSENAEYHAAKEAQSHNEGRVMELEDKLGRAEVIDPTKMTGDNIKFGATVKMVDEDTDEEKIYLSLIHI